MGSGIPGSAPRLKPGKKKKPWVITVNQQIKVWTSALHQCSWRWRTSCTCHILGNMVKGADGNTAGMHWRAHLTQCLSLSLSPSLTHTQEALSFPKTFSSFIHRSPTTSSMMQDILSKRGTEIPRRLKIYKRYYSLYLQLITVLHVHQTINCLVLFTLEKLKRKTCLVAIIN